MIGFTQGEYAVSESFGSGFVTLTIERQTGDTAAPLDVTLSLTSGSATGNHYYFVFRTRIKPLKILQR